MWPSVGSRSVAEGDAAALRSIDLTDAIKETRDAWALPSAITGGDALLQSVFTSAVNILPGNSPMTDWSPLGRLNTAVLGAAIRPTCSPAWCTPDTLSLLERVWIA